ncbi:hypothetical protein BDQ17DRAFT_1441260 [Cyathus striatus]|nr:hypothetical protein BDQ17DRAFT_1441260 [Cyathus striatus]
MEGHFIGNKQVEEFRPEDTSKIPFEDVTKQDTQRRSDNTSQGGAAARASVASRDPKEFDTTHRGGQGDHLPTTEPTI